jgi:hypothetical protein
VAPEPVAFVAPLLLAAHPGFAMWAVHGLETSLFVFLTASAIWAADRRPGLAGVAAGLAFWTRPEGALWAVMLAAFAFFYGKRREAVRLLAVFAAICVAARGVPALLLRHAVSQHVLCEGRWRARTPGIRDQLREDVRLRACARHRGVRAGRVRGPPTRGGLPVPALSPASFGRRGARTSSGWAATRFPDIDSGFRSYRWPVRWSRTRFARRPSLGLAGGVVIVAVTAAAARADVRIEHETGREFTAKMIVAGTWLRDNVPPGTWVAVNYVGALPYYSGLPTIDMLGLTDPVIAHTPIRGSFRFPGHAKGNGASVLDRHPGVILMGGVTLGPKLEGALRTELASEDEIAADPRFESEYERVAFSVAGPTGPSWFEFYRRRDLVWPATPRP